MCSSQQQTRRITPGEVGIVRLTGDVDLANAEQVRQLIFIALAQHGNRILVDMTQVGYLDSSGISALISGLKLAREHGGELGLCGLTDRVWNVLRITGLDKLLPLFPDEHSAAEYLAGK